MGCSSRHRHNMLEMQYLFYERILLFYLAEIMEINFGGVLFFVTKKHSGHQTTVRYTVGDRRGLDTSQKI